tara:strand:+ start:1389 stop:1577 length:189 start_codon:yes stop_codon:yes gene_type:complete
MRLFKPREQGGKIMKEYQYNDLTQREQERAQVRKNMRRWVKLREHFDKRPREEKKTVVSIIN